MRILSGTIILAMLSACATSENRPMSTTAESQNIAESQSIAGTTHPALLVADKADAKPNKKDATRRQEKKTMQVYYLEIVTKDVDAVCNAYAASTGVQFGKPVPGLGNARTASMPNGGFVGIRAPLRDDEVPVVRPYWLVDDIEKALADAVKAGGELAHPPLEIPGYGTFAIYLKGGNDHGLWKR